MTTPVGFSGFAPTVIVGPDAAKNPEQAKYEKMWAHDEYRDVAPGEGGATYFLSQARPKPDATVIDFGAGTGRGAYVLALLGKMCVTMLDFADNCLDPEVKAAAEKQPDRLRFVHQDLTKPITETAAYGFCTDVMEHIRPEDVDQVLQNILGAAQHVWFNISCTPDHMGALIGEPLHLTVQNYQWWLDKMHQHGMHVHYSRDYGEYCVFYGTTWAATSQVVMNGSPNAGEEVLNANVLHNLNDGWAQIEPHEAQEVEIMLLAGGPSLNDFEDQIKAARAKGMPLVTVNGTYNWALDRGLKPSLQIMVDGREFMERFVTPQVDTCKYLMASQVSPKVMLGLPRDRTWLWHSGINKEGEALAKELNGGKFFPIPGGCTVITRAIPLLRLLGFSKIHVYGFDSCFKGEAHHAYKQPENDDELVLSVSCGGKTFNCTPWHVMQANEFMGLVKLLGDEVELEVYGDGLIKQILVTGASMEHSFPLS